MWKILPVWTLRGVGVYGSRPRCGSTIPSAFIWRVPERLAVFEIVWDPDGQPVDYVIVGLNDKFAEMFGVMPTLSCAPGFLSLCQKSWKCGRMLWRSRSERRGSGNRAFHLPTEAWLKVSLYSPAPNLVGLVVADMTAWVETAQALESPKLS